MVPTLPPRLPPVDERSLADAEQVLHWVWTETGFRARLPRTPTRVGLFVSVILAVVGYCLLVMTRPEIALLISLIGVLGISAYVLALSRRLWWPALFGEDSVAEVTPQEDHRLVDLVVDRGVLGIGRRRFALVEIEEIRMIDGTLEIVLLDTVHTEPVPRFARRAVQRVLVPFVTQARVRAKESARAGRREERAARAATANLRSHASEAALRDAPGSTGPQG